MIDVGQIVGNYEITAKIGEGGMGVVYLAVHPVIGKKVAMKAIHPELSRNPEVVSRFVMEAKAVNQIGHDHIVDISDFGNMPSGDFYFVMEYLQGESLADRLKREVLISQTRALGIAAQVADALGASHDHGIIHRDLKPENIFLITRRGNPDFVKVLDFGLAKLTQVEEKVNHKTRAGSVMGTPYYMSPEQGEGKLQIDNRADIYSLGIILFEMLTGKVPFGGEGYGEIIVKHITHQAPSARKINPAVSAAVEMILFRALAKERSARFQSMQEFRDALLDPEGYIAGTPTTGMPAELTGVTRLAAPMARKEMNFGNAVTDFRGGREGGVVTDPNAIPSTFRHGVGQMSAVVSLRPKANRKLLLGMAGGVALVGLFVSLTRGSKHDTRKTQAPTAAGLPGPGTPPERRPTTVRINFSSDPAGATVLRTLDGWELGKTPLSVEIPYSDASVEFKLRLAGYEDKSVTIVPNLPAPFFATLRPVVPAVGPTVAAPSSRRAGGGGGLSRRQAQASNGPALESASAPGGARRGEKDKERDKDKGDKDKPQDEDEVMAPDFK
jgi:serine/threonine-protein kinase